MKDKILQMLEINGKMTECQITKRLLHFKDIPLFTLYNGQKRSCEVRILLSELIRSGKIVRIKNRFVKNSS